MLYPVLLNYIICSILTVKIVIPKDIFNLFDEVAFSHWISGDGKPSLSGGLTLCTNSFTIPEVVLLINVLIIRYELECSIHTPRKVQFRKYIYKNSMEKVRNLVAEQLVDGMLYKVHLVNKIKNLA